VAKEACNQIQKLYPLEQWDTDTRTCIADAVKVLWRSSSKTRVSSAPEEVVGIQGGQHHDCASDRNNRSRFHPALHP
jgi:hypothetical protein